jgi:uncharacterized protein
MAGNFTLSFTTAGADLCSAPITQIPVIQGTGAAVTTTSIVTTRGVVIGDYEGTTGLNGFYLQAATGDGDPATSDAIFVFNPNNNSVNLGDVVTITGTPAEFQNQSQIGFVTSLVKCGTGTVAPLDIALPMASSTAFESYEGMLVRFAQPLYVTEHFQLGRFGQVVVSGTDRLRQPTAVVAPGQAALDLQAANNLNKLIIDDTLQTQNPDPIIYGRNLTPLSASNTLRGGDTTTGAVGVLTYTWAGNAASGNAFRLRPPAATPLSINFTAVNSRPSEAPAVGGSLRAVGLNLLNYFNTFTLCANGLGDVAPANDKCRGAENATEFTRQSDKTVAALIKLNADVIGVNEIENDGYGSASAIQDLVSKLNAATAPGTYAFIDADARTGLVDALGTDGIKVGLIYKPGTVSPIGTTRVLDSVAFVNGGDGSPRNRVSLAQAFEEVATGGRIVVNVNHFKSKGSACDAAAAADGQGNCAVVRTKAAETLAAWLATDPTGVGDPDILLLGDYNSYAKETPITTITAAGYNNLVESFGGPNAYSYVFDGQWGYLDYAFSSPTLTPQVTGVAEYHINSDEPSVLDYNTNFKSAGQLTTLYGRDEFRVSDHDPVIVGLSLTKPASTTSLAATPAAIVAGQPFTVSATVAPVTGSAVPTGSISFSDGTPLSTVVVDATGRATLNQTRPAGVYSYVGTYSGAPNLGASTGALSVTVQTAPATASVAVPATTPIGTRTLLTATLSSPYLTPTGTVTFYDGTTAISGPLPLTAGSAANTATASFSWSAGPVGSRLITAQYSGLVPVKPRVRISQVCTPTTTAQYNTFTWAVTNLSAAPVTFVWRVKGAKPAQTGTITLAPGATSAAFTTSRWARNTTLEILVNNKVIEDRDAKKTRSACLNADDDDDDDDKDDNDDKDDKDDRDDD